MCILYHSSGDLYVPVETEVVTVCEDVFCLYTPYTNKPGQLLSVRPPQTHRFTEFEQLEAYFASKAQNLSSHWLNQIMLCPLPSSDVRERSPPSANMPNHFVFCPMAAHVRKCHFHREVRKCVLCQWLIAVLAQQLWGSRPHCDVSVAMETARAEEGLRWKRRKGEGGRWGTDVREEEGKKSSCLYSFTSLWWRAFREI